MNKAASVEVTSEDEKYPIESALLGDEKRGWRAAEPGIQTIRLIFDSPQRLQRIWLAFEEQERSRTQEFVLRWCADAVVRVRMNWSSAVGSLDDVRDLHVRRDGSVWRVVWPKPAFHNVPPQVVSVNYLRWEVIGRNTSQAWGAQDVDSPKVRITSMNAIARPDRVVILGEVENEDTVPAYLNVNATLLKADGSPLEEEGSFDLISHVLLPKQVSPYRIDFPGIQLSAVKSVRMDARALLVPASADPVIAVSDQTLGKDALNRNVLKGDLVNQSGRPVNIAQVLAAYYDSAGKVIWVSDGYVDQALMPQVPVPFAVDIPDDIAERLKNYRVIVNHYSRTSS